MNGVLWFITGFSVSSFLFSSILLLREIKKEKEEVKNNEKLDSFRNDGGLYTNRKRW